MPCMTDYFIPELLPNLLSKFRKQYPNIHLEIQTGVGIDLIPLFEKGAFPLGITRIADVLVSTYHR